MRRYFNKSEKQELYIISKGKCSSCNSTLLKNWHADHVIPFSKGGKTILSNGQALCPKCNFKKNNKMEVNLRNWQQEFYTKPYKYYADGKSSFLCAAGVGSGKTIAGIYAAKKFLEDGFSVIVISPTEEIKRNWAREFKNIFDYDIDTKYSFKYSYKRVFNGISITYQSLNDKNIQFLLRAKIIDSKTIIILDEIHHAGEDKSWGDSIIDIGLVAGFVLSFTGTPYRSDNVKLPFAEYKPFDSITDEFRLKTDYEYTYKDSVKDMYCCPISFRGQKVVIDNKYEGAIEDNQDGRQRLNMALTINGNDYVYKLVKEAEKKLDELREVYNYAGLILCKSIADAEALHERMPYAELVTSADSEAANKIHAFKDSTNKWIITVKMVAEGVDIPRVRVIVYGSNVSTRLFFTQVTGRGVRNRNDSLLGAIDYNYFFYPETIQTIKWATEIELSLSHIVEEQEEQITKSKRKEFDGEYINPYENSDFDREAGDIINSGIIIPPNVSDVLRNIYGIDKVPSSTIEEIYKLMVKATGTENPKVEKQLKRDRINSMRSEIHKEVGRIHYLSDKEISYKDIHRTLNSKLGYRTTSDIEDIDILKNKLSYAKQWKSEIL